MENTDGPRLRARPWSRIAERVGTANKADESRKALPVVAVAVALAVTSAAVVADFGLLGGHTAVALVLILIGALAEVLPYEGEGNGAVGSVALIPNSAAILVQPDVVTLLFAAGFQVLVQLYLRRGFAKLAFNVSQATLSLGAAIIVLRLILGSTTSRIDQGFLAAGASLAMGAVPAFATLMVVNRVAVATVVSAVSGTAVSKLLAIAMRKSLAIFAMQMIFGLYLAWLAVHLGAVGAAGMVLPMLAVRQLSRNTIQLTRVTEELLDLMVAAIEARDPYTSGHSKRVAAAATRIAKAMGLGAAEVERVQVAALLHDVGKIHEEFARILAKEGRLTPEEWDIMKRHPVRSAELVGLVSSLKDVVPAVRHHHENWDGTGYPEGKKSEEIPLASRIIMFADTLDAITTDRPYRRALNPEEARKEFIKFRGRQFDPRICDVVVSDGVWADLYQAALRSQEPVSAPSVTKAGAA